MMKTKMMMVAAAGVLVMSLAACGEEVKTIGGGEADGSAPAATTAADAGAETAPAAEEGAGTETVESAATGYTFEISGVQLYPDMDVTTVPEALGEYTHYEEESCAAQGMAHFYTFADYEINTWPDGDIDRIYYILLKTDNVATKEGVDLSMNKDKIIEVYGDGYQEDGHKLSYEKDGMKLVFILNDDNTIASIEYDSCALGE
ncbi:MAG: hypothetical protein IKO10_14775 [Lachnospiraceae bacterium]|nr:hypothetical protein [Lachnospiraceae bacterium]